MTEKEFKTCKSKKAVDAALKVLRMHINMPKFKLGDVVVAYYQSYRSNSESLVMQNEGCPKRWVVCHIDDDGIIFAKQILSNGRFGKGVYCLAEVGYRFDIDPDFLELVLLGQEDQYNPVAWTKDITKKRAKLSKLNKDKALDWEDIKHAHSVMDTWKVGDVLYRCGTRTPSEKQISIHKIKAIHKKPIPEAPNRRSYYGRSDRYDGHRQAGLKFYYEVEVENYNSTINDTYIWNWYAEKPTTLEMI